MVKVTLQPLFSYIFLLKSIFAMNNIFGDNAEYMLNEDNVSSYKVYLLNKLIISCQATMPQKMLVIEKKVLHIDVLMREALV